MTMEDKSGSGEQESGPSNRLPTKRVYRSPVLTEYGSIEQLVDSGVVGSAPSIVIQ
jgi:hypothetical protein